MSDVATSVPGATADPDTTVGSARKSHIVLVGHLVGDQLFGAERSLLDILAAVDRRRHELSCVLPNSNDAYLRAVAKYTSSITVFPYQWWSKAQPFDQEAVARFESIFRGVDLVHVNTMTLMDPLLAARRRDVPSIVHARELVDQDEELARHFGNDPSSIVQTIRAASDFIIANSEATHRLYRKDNRSFRLYNSIDIEQFDLPNALDPGKLKIGIISNNQRRKGIESFVNLEAMAARRPVIAYRWGATPELVRHGTDGFLIPHLDFAKALEHLATLADHPDRLLEMGRNGRERAEQLFSPEVFASQLNGIYRRIMDVWKARGRDRR
jgi:glycosyltransferase involved in cell wall biosynthesis